MDSIPQWHLFSNDQPYAMHYLPGIFGKQFKDESFKFKHDRIGVLSMANRGIHTYLNTLFHILAPRMYSNLVFTRSILAHIIIAHCNKSVYIIGKDTNSSQFFLCFGPAPWLDGRHVVFGNLIFGAETLRKIENQGSRSGKVRYS
jgi:cyclophilin family peptidyl-prolyl cis-trans isomerase